MKKLNQLLLNIIVISFSFYEAFAQNILRTEKYAANVKEIDYNNLIKTTARFKMPSDIKSIDFLEKTVILKLKSKFRFICTTNSINNDLFNLLYKNIEGNNLQHAQQFIPFIDPHAPETGAAAFAHPSLGLVVPLRWHNLRNSLKLPSP